MKYQKSKTRSAIVAVVAIATLAGCQTTSEAPKSNEPPKSAMQSAKEGTFNILGGIRDWFIPTQTEPLVESLQEEYCALPNVIAGYSNSEIGPAVLRLSKIRERFLSKEEKAKSLFCNNVNVGGLVLITDRSMNLALGEMQNGVQVASQALNIKIKGQRAMLARIARMKNLSIGEKLDPKYAKDLDRLNDDVSRLQDAAEKKLDRLAKSGGITKDVQAKLEEAHKHFVGFRHYQGKALSGIALFDAARKLYGPQIIYQAFAEAIKIDQRQRLRQGKKAGKKFPATQKLANAFVSALPKFAETMFSGAKISTAIWKAADKSDFDDALKAVNEPPKEKIDELATYASDVNASTASLGLPSASGSKG